MAVLKNCVVMGSLSCLLLKWVIAATRTQYGFIAMHAYYKNACASNS